MNSSTQRDELFRRILTQTDRDSAPTSSFHLDDETVALFIEGGLPSSQRMIAVEHLADCAVCRKLVAAIAFDEVSEPVGSQADSLPLDRTVPRIAPSSVAPPAKTRSMAPVFATISAATILLAVGLWFGADFGQNLTASRALKKYRQAEQLLAQADFDGARSVINAARQQGVRSELLTSLESQAIRHFPGSLALASAGRLTDFGYDVDGTVARGATPQTGLNDARQLLDSVPAEELETLLNRGHVALSAGDAAKAIGDFQTASDRAPENIWGWLGLGLAQFTQRDYASAEAAFHRCLEISPQDMTARINLAMTLQELDRTDEAAEIWRSLLAEKSLSERDRESVKRALTALGLE